ncbi:MAG: oxygen-independent coproporphyrinogen oxidase [Bacteroidota bacterium]
MNTEALRSLLHKYNVAVPRYTSYPTVPFWSHETMSADTWKRHVKIQFDNESREICLYIHLPFCEELCTYCACNKRITRNHAVEKPYLETLLEEWKLYKEIFEEKPVIREIHLGGGTPTFFSAQHLRQLIDGITSDVEIAPNHEFSIEVHPNNTTREQLSELRNAGFNRISIGVQDFDPDVQFIINRIQSFEQTALIAKTARELGYSSINVDLVYGLPKQTIDGLKKTIEQIHLIAPDRIAFYSYAHVPWKSKGQRRYTDEDVPGGELKLAMYCLGYSMLTEAGYSSIGMDHFALPDDPLMKAAGSGKLHRNFMGYTTTNHKLVVGLGASSIGDTWSAFAQNEKTVETYQERVMAGELPLIGGHELTDEDLVVRQTILDLMCRGECRIEMDDHYYPFKEDLLNELEDMTRDRLVNYKDGRVRITEHGQLLVRNVCSLFDLRLRKAGVKSKVFSQAI